MTGTAPLRLRALHLRLDLSGALPPGWLPALAPLIDTGPSIGLPVRYVVSGTPAGAVRLDGGGGAGVEGSAAAVLAHLLDGVRVGARGPDAEVVLHAGAVRRGSSVVLIPGVSGSGKSTLTAHLLRAGWELLSDELVGVAPDGTLAGCPLPLRLAPDACHLLGLPVPADRPKADVPLEALSPHGPAAGGTVTDVIFPRRRLDAPAELVATSRSRAVAELAASVFAGAEPRTSLAALAALTGGPVRCATLLSGDPREACSVLLAALAA